MCVCTYTHIHTHSPIYKHVHRLEAKYFLVRKFLKKYYIKVWVISLVWKISAPPPPLFHIETRKETSLIVFIMLKASAFLFDTVFYLTSSFIIGQKSILNIVLEARFLMLSTATRPYFCVCDVLHKIVYWYEAGCGTIFQLWSLEWIDF